MYPILAKMGMFIASNTYMNNNNQNYAETKGLASSRMLGNKGSEAKKCWRKPELIELETNQTAGNGISGADGQSVNPRS